MSFLALAGRGFWGSSSTGVRVKRQTTWPAGETSRMTPGSPLQISVFPLGRRWAPEILPEYSSAGR
jgi:hypothetical protein